MLENVAFFNIDFSSIFHGFGSRFGGSWGGFGRLLAVQNGSLKGTINFFDKNVIFRGFGKGLERVLGGSWESFWRVLREFARFWDPLRRFRDLSVLFWMLLVIFVACWCFCWLFLVILLLVPDLGILGTCTCVLQQL